MITSWRWRGLCSMTGGFNIVAFNNLSRFNVKLSFTGRLDDDDDDDDDDGSDDGRFMTFGGDLLSFSGRL